MIYQWIFLNIFIIIIEVFGLNNYDNSIIINANEDTIMKNGGIKQYKFNKIFDQSTN